MRFSYFNHFYDNVAQRCNTKNWNDFIKKMYYLSKLTGYKPSIGEYDKQQPLISSAIYGTENKRANVNVLGWECIILDVDDGIDALTGITELLSDYKYLIYSTANCTEEHLKVRIIIPLHKFASVDNCHAIWFAANEWCGKVVDKQTKDKARLHYVPAMYTNKGEQYKHIFITNEGTELNWEDLINEYPAPPEKDKFKIKNPLRDLKRKIFLDNKTIPSFNIMDDNCPFVYRKMIEEYRLTPVGGHHTAIYKFMVQCCYNAEKIKYPISIEELADMGKQLDDIDGGYYPESKMLNNAKDALAYTCI